MKRFLIVLVLLSWSTAASAQDKPKVAASDKQENLSHFLIGAMMVSQFTDLSTTMYGIGGHRLREANPALRWAQDRPIAMAVTKGSLAAISAEILLRQHKYNPKVTQIIAAGLTALLSYTSYKNAKLDKSLMTP